MDEDDFEDLLRDY